LAEGVRQKSGLSQSESAAFVELFMREVIDCLARGENVKLASFGSFLVRKKSQRPVRHPTTGKEVLVTPRRVIVFKPSGMMVERLAEANHQTRNSGESARVGSTLSE